MSRGPTEADYRGTRFADHPVDIKNCTDLLCLTQPQMIQQIHREYLDAGSDIIETNTFNGNVITLEEFHVADLTREINQTAIELAKAVADECTRKNPAKPRFVAGSIGPTKVQLSFNADKPGYRPVTFDQMVHSYAEQVRGMLDGGVDLLLPETSFDTLNMKAALYAIQQVFDEGRGRSPSWSQGRFSRGTDPHGADPGSLHRGGVALPDVQRRPQLRARAEADAPTWKPWPAGRTAS